MTLRPRPIAAYLVALVSWVWLAACPTKTVTRPPPSTDPGTEALRTDDLQRELELVILDNYLQLSVGNIETYVDTMARDREVMLLGIGPEDIFLGQNPGIQDAERRPFVGRDRCIDGVGGNPVCLQVLSKRLDTHLYRDDSVGWLSDELSYRVPYSERQAVIPLRITAVFIRDIDLWVMAAEHMSYPLPMREILDLAEAGELPQPKPFSDDFPPFARNEMRLFTNSTERWLNGLGAPKLVRVVERAALSEADKERLIRERTIVSDRSLLTLFPDPRDEFREDQVFEAPSLVAVFVAGMNRKLASEGVATPVDATRAHAKIEGFHIGMADNKRVAWMAANITVQVPGRTGNLVRIGLRGTFLYALDKYGWNLVQSHISVPVTQARLKARVFGSAPEIVNSAAGSEP